MKYNLSYLFYNYSAIKQQCIMNRIILLNNKHRHTCLLTNNLIKYYFIINNILENKAVIIQ